MPEFNTYFPTSKYGTDTINVMDFGAFADGTTHSMSELGYANLAAAQADYPSATGMNDTADWCAITECIKQCYTDGAGTINGTAGWLNKPMCFPTGRYMIRKPLIWRDVTNATIFGTGYVQIYNETTTEPDNVCVHMDGMQNCRIDDLNIQSAGGTNSVGLNIDAFGATVVNTTGNIFYNCSFASPGGIACRIGGTQMSSELTFIRCNASISRCGFVLDNWNALNYQFLACGGILNTLNWIRVNMGGCIVVQNASLAANGTELPAGSPPMDVVGFDIYIGAGTAVILGSRTESKRFVMAGYPTSILSCVQANVGNDMVFAASGTAYISGCETTMGRLTGEGHIALDNCRFNTINTEISNIAAGASNGAGGNLIKITHTAHPHAADGEEWWLDGDQVQVVNVVSANTTAAGGAARTNGVWTMRRLTSTTLELLGSTFAADTYDYSNARIAPGPQFHMRDILHPTGDIPSLLQIAPRARRDVVESRRQNVDLLWSDSGKTFDNLGATGEIIFTLPNLLTQNHRGVRYRFLVLTAQSIKVQTFYPGALSPPNLPASIFRAGNYATRGITIASNVIGNSVELYLADGDQDDLKNFDYALGYAPIGHRWVVISETGTWTIAGTPI